MKENEPENTPSSKKPSAEAPRESRVSLFQSFEESLEKKQSPEDQLRFALSFMKEALSDSKKPRFKDFWETQKLCSLIFKEKMSLIKKKTLWSEYAELLKEARCLKEIVEEEAAFSLEQIDLAVEALEKEVEGLSIQARPDVKQLFSDSKSSFTLKKDEYHRLSLDLVSLKAATSRFEALRKELLGLSLKVGKKNHLLKRLDKLGDVIFPRRKQLIEKVSASFTKDVEDFVSCRFSDQEKEVDSQSKKPVPYYVLQKEIKSFQACAKMLHLNRAAFNQTRSMLSKAWDSLKDKESQSKKDFEKRSKESEENFEKISERVKDFKQFCQDSTHLVKEKILEKGESILEETRSLMLKKEAFSLFTADIQKLQKEALGKIEKKIIQKIEEGNKKIRGLKEKLSKLIAEEKALSIEELESQQTACISEYKSYELDPIDQQELERQFLDLKSFILDKKSEKSALKKEIEVLYGERLDIIQEIKNQIELYRKEMGGSALDIEKAMRYRELYDSAKIHLNKENLALKDLEEKFGNLES